MKLLDVEMISNECDETWQVEDHYISDGTVRRVKFTFKDKMDFVFGLLQQIPCEIVNVRSMTYQEKRKYEICD
jgi:hypothetical protein